MRRVGGGRPVCNTHCHSHNMKKVEGFRNLSLCVCVHIYIESFTHRWGEKKKKKIPTKHKNKPYKKGFRFCFKAFKWGRTFGIFLPLSAYFLISVEVMA